MKLRLVSTLTVTALITLSATTGGGSGEPRLVPDRLTQRASTSGKVPVIVRLNVGWAPETHLPTSAHVASQRQAIRRVAVGVRSGLRGLDHRVKRQYDGLPFLALEVDAQGLHAIESMRGLVVQVVEDEVRWPSMAESVPIAYQAGSPWPGGLDGTDTVVAVLDTGVEKAHPFLSGKVVAEACFSTTSFWDWSVTVCPDGTESSTAPGSGEPCPNDCDHGTHVAGTVAGGTTGTSGSGVAPGARIWAIQVFSEFNCGDEFDLFPCVGAYDSDLLQALDHVYINRNSLPDLTVASINMSLGGASFDAACDASPLKTAIDNLRAAGIATVIASGNAGHVNAIAFPACISSAIAVGSTDDGSFESTRDDVSYFSNIGPFPNLILAPGRWITSSVPGGGFATWEGTSMATPHVAGAFAVLRQREPAPSVTDLFNALRDTGLPVSDARPGGLRTKNRIRVGDALLLLLASYGFESATFSQNEHAGLATITVRRTGDTTGTATVNYATSNGTAIAGTHYAAASGTLTFGPGDTSKTFTVDLVDDTVVNANRTVHLTLSSPTGGGLGSPSTAVLTIVNDDSGGTITFAGGQFSVVENAGSATIEVVRTGTHLAGGVRVHYATANGTAVGATDYSATSGNLMFAAGEASKTFTVPVINNTRLDSARAFQVTLTAPTGGATLGESTTASVGIVDDEMPGVFQFSSGTYAVSEGTAPAIITITRTGANLVSGVRVGYATGTGGTARAGSDYLTTSGTLTFGAGVTSMTFAVPIREDTLVDGAETVTLALTVPAGSPAILGERSTAVLTIGDNDAPVIQFSPTTVSVTEGGTAVVTIVRANGLGSPVAAQVSIVGGTATGGTDYTFNGPVTVTIPAGQTLATVAIPTTHDTLVEGPETIVLALASPSTGSTIGTRNQTTVTILDNDQGGTIQFRLAEASVAENVTGGAFNIPVTRSGSSLGAGVTIDYAVTGGTATRGEDYTLADGTLTFAAGQTLRNIPVTILQDGLTEGHETIIVTLSNPGAGATLGTIRTTTITLTDDEPGAIGFSAPTYSVVEGSAISIPVTRSGPVTGGASVGCRTVAGGSAIAGTDYTAVNTVLRFGVGVRSVNCIVPTGNNFVVDGTRTLNLALSEPTGGQLGTQATAVLSIRDNDSGGVINFGSAAYGVAEGGIGLLTVVRSGVNLVSVTVDYAVTGGTATGDGSDYTLAAGTLTFGRGVTTRPIPVPTVNDRMVEGGETRVVTLSHPTSGATLGQPTSTTLTIIDNDQGGTIQFARAAYTVAENVIGGGFNVSVMRSGSSLGHGITVDYTVTGGSAVPTGDYVLPNGTLTFAAGQTLQILPITILNDDLAEGNETFVVTLSNPSPGATLGAIRTTTVTIGDEEPGITFSAPTYSVSEAVTSIGIPITRAGPAPAGTTVRCRTVEGGTAVAGTHYTAVDTVLSFGAGVRTVNCVVPIKSNMLVDGTRTVNLGLSDQSGGAVLGPRPTAVLSIRDDDLGGVIRFGSATYSIGEGATGQLVVTRTGGRGGAVTVDYAVTGGTATGNGADYTLATGTLTFDAGVTSRMLPVPTVDDTLAEGSETVLVTLSNPTGSATLGAPSATTLTITDIETCVSNRHPQPRAILSRHATTGKSRGAGTTATARD